MQIREPRLTMQPLSPPAMRSRASATDGILDLVARAADQRGALSWFALFEAFLSVALVTGAAAAVPGHWGLLDVQPHPLWLVVLAIAIRYGSPAGYAGGAFAAAGYCLLSWLQPGALAGSPEVHPLLQPVLLFAGGAIIGELVQGRQRRLTRTEEALRLAAASLQSLTTRYQTLREVQGELEKSIVGQPASIASLYRTAKQLSSLDSSAVCTAAVNLVAEYLEVETCSLYLDCDGSLRWRAGIPSKQAGSRYVLDASQPLVSQALREHRVATIHEQIMQGAGPTADDLQAIMVGPLLDGAGRIRGVVVIERLPFLKFTPTAVQLFELLVDWVSTALQNAEAHERARASATMFTDLAS
jgi:hypothetical protein